MLGLNILASYAWSQSTTDQLLSALYQGVQQKASYVQAKQAKIDRWKKLLQEPTLSLQSQFDLNQQLYYEYKLFQYEAAFATAVKLQAIARQLQDSQKINTAKLQLSFTLLSSGMCKEALDSLQTMQIANMPSPILAEYYLLLSRTYYELAAYSGTSYYVERYNQQANRYADSAMTKLNRQDWQYYYVAGLKAFKERNFIYAKDNFKHILNKFHPDTHEYAIIASSLASVYMATNHTGDTATQLMMKAALADVKSSTKEGVALVYVADLLYRQKQDERAYVFIKSALEDATFYGAKLRLQHVSGILPIIEGNRLLTVEGQKNRLFTFTLVVSVLSLLVIIFAFIIFKQLKQLKIAGKKVTEANHKLQEANGQLQATNAMLQAKNNELLEAHKIKEEYIGYSFNMYATYLDKIEKIKKNLEKRLASRSLESIAQALDSINLKKEREALYLSFDKIFMKLFPNFIDAFNRLFREEEQYQRKEEQPLDLDIRIFALIRIGISDHEQIAKILEYSVRTIYNHKTKVKTKSLVPNEQFEQKVMEIRAF